MLLGTERASTQAATFEPFWGLGNTHRTGTNRCQKGLRFTLFFLAKMEYRVDVSDSVSVDDVYTFESTLGKKTPYRSDMLFCPNL